MKRLITVLFVVLVNCYVSPEVSAKKQFNDYTFPEFKESCSKMNKSYESLRNSSEIPLWRFQMNTFLQNCSESNTQEPIKELIGIALQCFDKDEQPNEAENNTIIKEIRKKLCARDKLLFFALNHSNCTDDKNLDMAKITNECVGKDLSDPFSEADLFFYSLAMTHSEEDCKRQFNIIRCSTNAMKGICNGTLANELDEIFQETSSILKCVKK